MLLLENHNPHICPMAAGAWRRHGQRGELGATVLQRVDCVAEQVHVSVHSYMCSGDVFN